MRDNTTAAKDTGAAGSVLPVAKATSRSQPLPRAMAPQSTNPQAAYLSPA
jgi:hypothetical protein